jgi:hypothetical protein
MVARLAKPTARTAIKIIMTKQITNANPLPESRCAHWSGRVSRTTCTTWKIHLLREVASDFLHVCDLL